MTKTVSKLVSYIFLKKVKKKEKAKQRTCPDQGHIQRHPRMMSSIFDVVRLVHIGL